jgi:AraC-like DNA-binding protein
LSEPEHLYNQEQRLGALNNLGLCYRYGLNDLDRSDSCFRAILQTKYLNSDEELKRDLWDAVATGNLGRNNLLRKEYDKAIPLFLQSLETVLKHRDYTYASLLTLHLANIYLQKNNLTEAKRYIDLFYQYNLKKEKSEYWDYLCEIKSKYYTLVGNPKLAIVYLDSMLTENKRKEEERNAFQILRVEQRQHLSEQKLKEEELNIEKIRSYGYKRSLVITFAALLLIGSLLAFYVVLYRKKKAAYHELVHKSQEWAYGISHVDKPDAQIKSEETIELREEEKEPIAGAPDATDISVMQEIEKVMEKDKLYRYAEFSMELLAQKLGAKRHYVSIAINRCTKKSFSTFVNEYRIKEAIKLLSENNANMFTLESVAFESGFADRYNFYRVFKKMTGLTPSEFKNNLD